MEPDGDCEQEMLNVQCYMMNGRFTINHKHSALIIPRSG